MWEYDQGVERKGVRFNNSRIGSLLFSLLNIVVEKRLIPKNSYKENKVGQGSGFGHTIQIIITLKLVLFLFCFGCCRSCS